MKERERVIGGSFNRSRPIRAQITEATVENGSTNGDDSWKANSLYIKMASPRTTATKTWRGRRRRRRRRRSKMGQTEICKIGRIKLQISLSACSRGPGINSWLNEFACLYHCIGYEKKRKNCVSFFCIMSFVRC